MSDPKEISIEKFQSEEKRVKRLKGNEQLQRPVR